MKIIDEKGRLFGKINVVDFLVILFFLFLVPAFYFGYKILTKKPMVEVLEKEFIEIETDCRLIKLKTELLGLISIGDKELDENGEVIGEIIRLDQSMPYKYEFDIGKDQKIIKEHPTLKQIDAKLKLTAEVKQGKPYYKDREIRIGSPLKFKTKKYSLMTIPIEEIVLEEEEEEERIINLNVTLKDLDEETLKKISVGDKELDESGNTIAEILSLGKIENSTTKINLGGGNVIEGEASDKKQIYARMRLRCQVKEGNQIYFKGEKVEYNTPLVFKTDEYEIFGLSTDKFEKEDEGEERVIDLNVTLKDLDDSTLKKISVGDKELDDNGNTIANILRLGKIENSTTKINLGGGNVIEEEASDKKQIYARMRLRCQVKEGNQIYFKGEKVEYNTPLVFETDEYEIFGLSTDNFEKEDEGEERIIDLNVVLKDLDHNTLKKISVGDKELDESGNTIANILSLGKIENSTTKINLGGGNVIEGEASDKKQIYARMRLRCQVKEGNQIYFKGEKVEYNTPLIFKTDEYEIKGLSAEDYEPYRNEKWFSLKVKFARLAQEIANVIKEGDVEKDEFGRTIATVNKIISNEEALVTDIYEGEFITLRHPFDRDVLAYIDVLCIEKAGVYYFKDEMAKMGIKITLNTESYSISGLIIGIEVK